MIAIYFLYSMLGGRPFDIRGAAGSAILAASLMLVIAPLMWRDREKRLLEGEEEPPE